MKNFLKLSDSHFSIVLNFFGKFLGLVTILYLANIFSQNLFGLYSFLIALAGFLAIFFKLGLPPYLTKNTSSLLVSGVPRDLEYLWHLISKFLIGSFIILSLVIMLVLNIDLATLTSLQSREIVLCLFIAFSISFAEITASMIRGMGYVKSSLLSENLIRPILFLVLISLTISMIKDSISLILLLFLISYFIANIINKLILSYIKKKYLNLNLRSKFKTFEINNYEIGSYFSFSLLQILMSQYSLLLFPFFSSYSELAIYRISYSGGFLLTTILLAIAVANIHSFANLYSEKKYSELSYAVSRCSYESLIYSLILIFFACMLAPYAITLILDDIYQASLYPFYILAVAQIYNAAFGLSASVLQMSKFQFYNNISLICSVIVGSIIFAYTVENNGANGAAFSYAASIFIYVSLSQIFCKINLGFFVNPLKNLTKS